jgi:hypothetical protein
VVFLFGVAVLAWPRRGSRERLIAAMLNLGEVPKSRDGCDDQHGTKYASERRENKTRVHNSACLKILGGLFFVAARFRNTHLNMTRRRETHGGRS